MSMSKSGSQSGVYAFEIIERAFSPFSSCDWTFLGRCPRLMVRAFGAFVRIHQIGFATKTLSRGPKAWPIPAWGNGPGIETVTELRAEGPIHREGKPLRTRFRSLIDMFFPGTISS